MSLLFTIGLGIPLAVYLLIKFYVKTQKKYFKQNGIPYAPFSVRKSLQFMFGTKNLIDYEEEWYQDVTKIKAPLVATQDGMGSFCLVINDLDLLKSIVVKDFSHFVNRRPMNTTGLFKRFLFSMDDDQWKGIRTKMTPAFSSGKIKKMFNIFKSSGQRMESYFKREMNGSKSVELNFSEIVSKYMIDVIASCCFAVDSNCWENQTNQLSTFEEMSKKMEFQFTFKNLVKAITISTSPKLADVIGLDLIDSDAESYFRQLVTTVVKHRRQTGARQEDFLQLMLDVQAGTLKDDDNPTGSQKSSIQFEDEDILANSLLFFNGGVDPTVTVLLFTLYSLATEKDVQEKLYDEVSTVLKKHNGEFTYEALSEMTYLDMILNETMRLYPAAPRVDRVCTQDYQVNGTNVKVKRGDIVVIPIHGIHLNQEYYPDPKKFHPERFNAENKAGRHPYAFLPFGLGPRSCIATRFGIIQVKTAIAGIVRAFKVNPSSKTLIPMDFDSSASAKPKGGMWLELTER